MKYTLQIFLLAVLTLTACNTQEPPTTFVLVRHAEKAIDGTKNPPLNADGQERAIQLAQLLSKQKITALYATPYLRTEQTLAPLGNEKNLTLINYDANSGKEWLTDLCKKHSGETIVIAGHSNTIPGLANALLGEEKFTQFEDDDYANLLIIYTKEVGVGTLTHLQF